MAASQPHQEPCAVQVAVQVSRKCSFDHFGCKFSDCGGCKFRGCTLLVIQVERLWHVVWWLAVIYVASGWRGGGKGAVLRCLKVNLEAILAVNFVGACGEVKSFWVDHSPNCTTTGGTLPANPSWATCGMEWYETGVGVFRDDWGQVAFLCEIFAFLSMSDERGW